MDPVRLDGTRKYDIHVDQVLWSKGMIFTSGVRGPRMKIHNEIQECPKGLTRLIISCVCAVIIC